MPADRGHFFKIDESHSKDKDESKARAMNDRVIALEHRVDELKLIINKQSTLKQFSPVECSIQSQTNQKRSFREMLFGNALQLKEKSIFQSGKITYVAAALYQDVLFKKYLQVISFSFDSAHSKKSTTLNKNFISVCFL